MNQVLFKSALPWIVSGAQIGAPPTTTITTPEDAATTLSVVSTDGGLTRSLITDGGAMIGLVGDAISLSTGNHRLRLSVAHGYRIEIGLAVDGNGARVMNHVAIPPLCSMVREVTWKAPSVFTSGQREHAAEPRSGRSSAYVALLIPTPKIGATLRNSECATLRSLSCNGKYGKVRFSSEPVGAEIWINDGKKDVRQDLITPSTMSVPYCEGRDTVRVMLRAPGKVTCPQDVKLSGTGMIDVRCELLSAPQPAPSSGPAPAPAPAPRKP